MSDDKTCKCKCSCKAEAIVPDTETITAHTTKDDSVASVVDSIYTEWEAKYGRKINPNAMPWDNPFHD